MSGLYGLRNQGPLSAVLLYTFQQSIILAHCPQALLCTRQLEPMLTAILVVAIRNGVRYAAPADGCVGLLAFGNLDRLVRASSVYEINREHLHSCLPFSSSMRSSCEVQRRGLRGIPVTLENSLSKELFVDARDL